MVSIPLGVRKGAWTEEEDILLRKCIEKYGEGKWHLVPLRAGLNRCRKSCRLRWLNYLRPNIKRGNFAVDEVDLIIRLHKLLGNRWSLIAGRLPGRTANDVKNYWNTHLLKKYSTIRYESNASASETSESRLVKPQPRTFSRNASWLREKSASADDTRMKENLDEPSSSSPAPPDDDDDVMQWWETLFATTKEIGEGKSWSSLSVSEEEHVKGLWSEEISPGVKEDDKLLQEKESGLADVSFEIDIWDLL